MAIKDFRKNEIKDLHKMLATKREQVRDMRFSVSNKQLKNIRDIRKARKEIAQVLTVLKEKLTKN
ncbi:50S ribosomal protein L29 [Patescibacteria group bacterium]|nr:50S ribosomal protein L29 [Patescibacteria group bacterium]